jgi:hypothetical protein
MKKVLNSIFSFNVRNAFQLPDHIISLLTEEIGIVRTELARFPVRAFYLYERFHNKSKLILALSMTTTEN